MKRDMNLVRKILFEIEKADGDPRDWIELEIDGYDQLTVCHHVAIMEEAGLVDAINLSTSDEYAVFPRRMTWDGQDFLAAVRKDSIWEKVKAKAGGEVVDVPFAVAKAWATALLT